MAGNVIRTKDVSSSLGFRAKQREMRLRYTWRMLQDNYNDLIKALKDIEDHPISSIDQRNRLGKNGFDLEGRFDFVYEVQSPTVRALTNYIATMFTLREVLYKLNDFMKDSMGTSDIRSKMGGIFSNHPEAAFLQDLRDNCLHGDGTQPTLWMEENRQENGDYLPTNYFCFDKSILEKGDWNSKSKQFITSWTGKKLLKDIIGAYQKDIESFYTWALDYYRDTFKNEYDKTTDLENKYFSQSQSTS